MTFKVVQWNMNGYINNYHELELLIKEKNPDVICIQETHIGVLSNNNFVYPKQYLGYFANLQNIQTNKQGVGIIIKRVIPHELIHINSTLSTIALKVKLNSTLCIANTYIPPSQDFNDAELINLFLQLPEPLLWTGDFNAWNRLWGSRNSNRRGLLIENFVSNHNLTILNNDSPTHISTHSSLTNVDITLSSSQISPRMNWEVSSDLHGSDHFPILITIQVNLHSIKYNHLPKFKPHLAN